MAIDTRVVYPLFRNGLGGSLCVFYEKIVRYIISVVITLVVLLFLHVFYIITQNSRPIHTELGEGYIVF